MTTLIIAAQLLLSLTILVTLHEMGHFFPSKWSKTRVEKFYLFFDFLFPISTALPYSLVRWIRNADENKTTFFKDKSLVTFYRIGTDETEYGLGWFPLGGYVKISGMVDESMDTAQLAQEPQPWEFRSKSTWWRLLIMMGGIIVNFLLGILIFSMLLFVYGDKFISNSDIKQGIYADSLGMQVGLRTGDKIVSVNGKPFEKFDDRFIFKEIIINNAQSLVVNRDGREETIAISPTLGSDLASYKNKDKVLFYPMYPSQIHEAAPGMPAAAAGLEKDDILIGVNGQDMTVPAQFSQFFQAHVNQSVKLKLLRNQKDTIVKDITVNDKGKIGVAFENPETFFPIQRQKYGFFESFPAGAKKGVNFLGDQVKAFGQMFRGKIKASESLGGLGSMAKMFSPVWDWEHFWRMTGILSFVLAFMNLLPIPGLDGGYVVFLLWEMITGRKPNDAIVEKATSVGLILLLGLMLYANGMDIVRAFFTK